MGYPFSYSLIEPFGARIDLDLSRPLSPDEAAGLRALFFTHGIVVFHAQRLSMDDQKRVVSLVGPLLEPSAGYLSPEDGILNTRHLDFHSDLSSTPLPFDAISLHAQDVEGPTTTRFASGLRAYRCLSPALKARIEGLQMLVVQTVADKTKLRYDAPAGPLSLVRPVVMTHRVTGEPLLYCNESATARLGSLDQEASDALRAELFTVLYAPDNIYEHAWTNGDLVLWDNLSLQHARPELEPGRPRLMQRVVAGLKTLREQVPSYDLTPVVSEASY
jgi:taurine dioxygenase